MHLSNININLFIYSQLLITVILEMYVTKQKCCNFYDQQIKFSQDIDTPAAGLTKSLAGRGALAGRGNVREGHLLLVCLKQERCYSYWRLQQ